VQKGAIKACGVTQAHYYPPELNPKTARRAIPFSPRPCGEAPDEVRQFLLYGDPEREFELRTWSKKHPTETRPFEGVLAALDYAFRNTSSDWLKTRLMSFQIQQTCSVCHGARLNPYVLAVTLDERTFAQFLGFNGGAGA
jgi:excinuclease UvrABC ATPase subunit